MRPCCTRKQQFWIWLSPKDKLTCDLENISVINQRPHWGLRVKALQKEPTIRSLTSRISLSGYQCQLKGIPISMHTRGLLIGLTESDPDHRLIIIARSTCRMLSFGVKVFGGNSLHTKSQKHFSIAVWPWASNSTSWASLFPSVKWGC